MRETLTLEAEKVALPSAGPLEGGSGQPIVSGKRKAVRLSPSLSRGGPGWGWGSFRGPHPPPTLPLPAEESSPFPLHVFPLHRHIALSRELSPSDAPSSCLAAAERDLEHGIASECVGRNDFEA